eukprot:6868889-Ditylum_brightwellii.AAC.1
MRLTAGRDRINYSYKVSTPTTDTMTAKIVINSTISTPNTPYMCANTKNFYLGTPLSCYEYMQLPIDIIPEEGRDEYKLHEK